MFVFGVCSGWCKQKDNCIKAETLLGTGICNDIFNSYKV